MARAGLADTVEALYQAAAEPTRWPFALEQLADHVGGVGSILVHNDFERKTGAIINARLRDDLDELYTRQYTNNPIVLAAAARGTLGQPDFASALIGDATLNRTAFHADILAPQRIVDQIVLPHRALSGRGTAGGFGVMFTSRQADDRAAALKRMRQITPHLLRAFDLSVEMARRGNDSRRFDALLDAMPMAAMTLDRLGCVTRANAAGEAMMALDDGIRVEAGYRLTATLRDEASRLRRAIAEAVLARSGDYADFRDTLIIQRGSQLPPLLVLLTPLPPASFPLWDIVDRGACLLVQIIDPVAALDGSAERLRKAYGLTPSEARVAASIAAGLTTPQTARRLGVSVNTVKTHLARCFEKTGVHAQAGLARLMSSVAPRD